MKSAAGAASVGTTSYCGHSGPRVAAWPNDRIVAGTVSTAVGNDRPQPQHCRQPGRRGQGQQCAERARRKHSRWRPRRRLCGHRVACREFNSFEGCGTPAGERSLRRDAGATWPPPGNATPDALSLVFVRVRQLEHSRAGAPSMRGGRQPPTARSPAMTAAPTSAASRSLMSPPAPRSGCASSGATTCRAASSASSNRR